MNSKRYDTKKLVLAAILTAIVIILQLLGQFVRFGPFSISLVLLPIVIGAAKCGASIGAWLGFVFGAVVLLNGDAAPFLAVNPAGTVITVLLKGTACGLAAGFAYKALSKINRYIAVVVAAIVCPIVNTGVFLLGCIVFFMDTIQAWAISFGFENVAKYMVLVLVGGNFLFEIFTNIILSPVSVRLLDINKTNDASADKAEYKTAIISLVCGLVGFLFNPLYVVSIFAIILGMTTISTAKNNPRFLAAIGLVLGVFSCIFACGLDVKLIGSISGWCFLF